MVLFGKYLQLTMLFQVTNAMILGTGTFRTGPLILNFFNL